MWSTLHDISFSLATNYFYLLNMLVDLVLIPATSKYTANYLNNYHKCIVKRFLRNRKYNIWPSKLICVFRCTYNQYILRHISILYKIKKLTMMCQGSNYCMRLQPCYLYPNGTTPRVHSNLLLLSLSLWLLIIGRLYVSYNTNCLSSFIQQKPNTGHGKTRILQNTTDSN